MGQLGPAVGGGWKTSRERIDEFLPQGSDVTHEGNKRT
jgi:hypothetical protein